MSDIEQQREYVVVCLPSSAIMKGERSHGRLTRRSHIVLLPGPKPLPSNSLIFAVKISVDFHWNLYPKHINHGINPSTAVPPKLLPWQGNKTHIKCQASKNGLNLISQHCRSIGHIHATSRSLSIC